MLALVGAIVVEKGLMLMHRIRKGQFNFTKLGLEDTAGWSRVVKVPRRDLQDDLRQHCQHDQDTRAWICRLHRYRGDVP
ncbi:hypothetical protein [Paraburkholderia panacisoli]|jgi:hypothetical protein|uniref:hypothetical protein n=1 Tax=Paraburkholderia panacisoli TaxID=2603818 RepID=UPI003CCC85C8